MKLVGDFHIHGRYAQACSKLTTITNLEQYAKIKGLDILGTGDCLHPKWFEEINSLLKEDENGVLWSKTNFPFIWQTELSFAYSQDGKGRRIHLVVLFPNKEVVIQVRDALLKRWRLDYDGRPIFGMSCIEFTELMMSISKDIEIIPAHMLTAWMSIFGSKSGFNSVEECFKEKSKYIHALETGMSSTPAMDRRISKLDKYQLVSFSDNHSFYPWRLGREATIFDTEINYKEIINAIRTGEKLKGTIETYPEYGKYHVDGHRACNITLNPEQTKKIGGVCPNCKRELTIGVAYRVEELADRSIEEGVKLAANKQTHCLIPLTEIIAASYDITGLASKKVWEIYNLIIKHFKTEFNVLISVPEAELAKVIHPKLASLIIKNREDKLNIKPGYDGVYGRIQLSNDEKVIEGKQKSLGEF
ncbi:MAG TPA: endonuclease Q family protein [Candidatus Nanoarchaeia archaeon]|nr:endonuclease Q family protein [Candidatus Nanoarchaeia archaeon]